MKKNTKLFLIIEKIQKNIKQKFIFFEIFFAKGIFFLFFGFLFGNLFGNILNIFRESIISNWFITLIILLFEELISYQVYHSEKRISFFPLNSLYKGCEAYFKKGNFEKRIILCKNKLFSMHFLGNLEKKPKQLFSQFVEKKVLFKKIRFYIQVIFIPTVLRTLTKHLKISANFATDQIKKINFFYPKVFILKSLNLCKIGILLGFFVDAFKVGS